MTGRITIADSLVGNVVLAEAEVIPPASFDWHVNSVYGNDANDGTLSSTAFKTVAKLLTVMQAGDSVGFARGSHFRETYSPPGAGCTGGVYGYGSTPIFDCSDVVAAGAWSNTSGHVYEFTPTVDYLVAYGAFNSIWEDDVRLPLVASVIACEAAPGSYYVATHATTTPTIYVHATGSGNPASNGKVYEYAKRKFGLYSETYANCGFNGLEARRNLSESGSIRVGRSSLLIDCIAREGNKHNIYYSDGCYFDGVQALDAYYAGASLSLFVYNEGTPISLGLTHIDCIADADTDGATYLGGSSGFYGHKNTSGDFGAVTFSGCQAKHCYAGFEGDSVTSMSYTNCIGTDCYNIFAARNSAPIVYTFTNCIQTVADALTFSVIFSDTLDGHTFNVTGCNWNFTGFAGGGGAIYSTGKDMIVNLNGNTFNIGTSWKSAVFALDGGAVTLYARNNNFQRTGAVTLVIYTLLDAASTVDSDYNTFGHSSMQFNIPAGNFASVAAYQAGTGQDAHSTVG